MPYVVSSRSIVTVKDWEDEWPNEPADLMGYVACRECGEFTVPEYEPRRMGRPQTFCGECADQRAVRTRRLAQSSRHEFARAHASAFRAFREECFDRRSA